MLVRSPRSGSNRRPDAYKFPAPRPHESVHVISNGPTRTFALRQAAADPEELLPKLLPRDSGGGPYLRERRRRLLSGRTSRLIPYPSSRVSIVLIDPVRVM